MSQQKSETIPWYRRHAVWILLAIGAYFLWMEHRVHVIAYLPLALIAACIGLHFFMHGSHGHGGHSRHDASEDTDPQPDVQPDKLSSDKTTEEPDQREESR